MVDKSSWTGFLWRSRSCNTANEAYDRDSAFTMQSAAMWGSMAFAGIRRATTLEDLREQMSDCRESQTALTNVTLGGTVDGNPGLCTKFTMQRDNPVMYEVRYHHRIALRSFTLHNEFPPGDLRNGSTSKGRTRENGRTFEVQIVRV